MIIEITWMKVLLALLTLVLLRGGWVLCRPNWGTQNVRYYTLRNNFLLTGQLKVDFYICLGEKHRGNIEESKEITDFNIILNTSPFINKFV